jgi:hypothetical protein
MSRVLMVYNDDRKVPHNACWWRLALTPNADGHVAVTQLHSPWSRERPPWSAHIDYFDGRNDWSWPFEHHLSDNLAEVVDLYRTVDLYRGHPYRYIYPTKQYLDVLDVMPPDVSETSRWLQLTAVGEQIYPTERLSFWPRSRQHWQWYERDFA